jgi:hypothetical protein
MAFVVFQGERKIADVVARAYGDLKVADRKRAEAALVRANPHLSELANVSKGSLIVVPPVPGLSPTDQTDLAAPAAEGVGAVGDSLAALQQRLRQAAKAEDDRLDALQTLLKSKPVLALLDRAPQARPYVERVTKAAKTRGDEQEARLDVIKRLDAARAELADLAAQLR